MEQIGSVYETMMGFRLERATGRSVAIKAQKKGGASTAVDLEKLAGVAPAARAKWVRERTDRKLTVKMTKLVRIAESVTDVHAALAKVVDTAATPDLVPRGAMILQPSDERRRSGSHYTPRELTAPIVEKALEPVLEGLGKGGVPKPAELLDLKICDPAMGSGAFLVEVCRQLAESVVEGWKVHGGRPGVPDGEDELVFAGRMVAQRCLYGVDRNPMAVDLAKMSLWLATLAKDEPLTFVDHALRDGDSLVGLTRRQIAAFTWKRGGAAAAAGAEHPGGGCGGPGCEAPGRDPAGWATHTTVGAGGQVGTRGGHAEGCAAFRRPGGRGVLSGDEGQGAGGAATAAPGRRARVGGAGGGAAE